MFEWNAQYETGIASVDEQHRMLIEILNKLFASIDDDSLDEDVFDEHLKALRDYWEVHFTDEHALMEEKGVSLRHRKLQEMEHHAFAYDVDRLMTRRGGAEDIRALAQRSASFVATWLSLHILGVDQSMARQIRAIDAGVAPEVAYARHKEFSVSPRTVRALVDSLLDMWREAEDRCEQLREELDEAREKAEA